MTAPTSRLSRDLGLDTERARVKTLATNEWCWLRRQPGLAIQSRALAIETLPAVRLWRSVRFNQGAWLLDRIRSTTSAGSPPSSAGSERLKHFQFG